jgi:hypothetical protein
VCPQQDSQHEVSERFSRDEPADAPNCHCSVAELSMSIARHIRLKARLPTAVSAGQKWRPRQDSNLRSRLRRPGLAIHCGVSGALPGLLEGL